jgi:hypothetical protein
MLKNITKLEASTYDGKQERGVERASKGQVWVVFEVNRDIFLWLVQHIRAELFQSLFLGRCRGFSAFIKPYLGELQCEGSLVLDLTRLQTLAQSSQRATRRGSPQRSW